MKIVTFTHPLWREVSGKRCALVWVEALAAIEKLWQEGRVERLEIHSRHVVERQRDVILEEVVTLVQENLQKNVYEVEQHGVPEQLLKSTHDHTSLIKPQHTVYHLITPPASYLLNEIQYLFLNNFGVLTALAHKI